MSDSSEFEFISRLGDFGLNEKEARLYYHLLKYGAKPPAVIARHMQTYREDVHRTLNSLLAKGMIAKSLSAPTVYVAVPPETAFEESVRKHESELREMRVRKQELVGLTEAITENHAIQESADGCRYRVLSGPNEAMTVSAKLTADATSQISSLMPGSILGAFLFSGLFDMVPDMRKRGARARLITDISSANLEAARYAIEHGVELRHLEPTGGVQFSVCDDMTSFVLMRFDPVSSPFRDTSLIVFLCESPTYARRLMYHYEQAWKQAVNGAERIRVLEDSG